ncbi:hypothetical protein [Alteraurantiacibacter buctensis]|uniref:Uncharacterized protein n=1 Tax=Alteraurantiacibacter buctensis TaxID=1503981 RepID=A0A844YUY4_9SPHN|nr:hypothetical protein [Alteraurantiacibacter buctensis]MXO70651.1 hypothetical protein [Alteraurantiacibacter buctensis]
MIERFLEPIRDCLLDPLYGSYMAVVIPGDLDPFERHYGVSIHLDAELRLARAGTSDGGGTLYFEADDESDEDEQSFTIIDIDATDVARTRAILRLHLPELGVPDGTLIQFGQREDRLEHGQWLLDQPRTVPDPFD